MQAVEFGQSSTSQDHQDRVLGVGWDVAEDAFVFQMRKKERPLTRRGLLGYVASMFDPEGAIAPVTLEPKQILQKMTREGLGWDNPLPSEEAKAVRTWLNSLDQLSSLKRPRYTAPKGAKIARSELHAFSDGSEIGYGYVLFARYITEEDEIHVSFLVGKALVTPQKTKTIPRIELQAALLSMRAIKFVVQQADVKWNEIHQWIDSTAVLAMLKNQSRRFLPYCANRLQEIRELQQELRVQIRHVPGPQNIADICSRGLTVEKFLQCQEYYNGPGFLSESPESWPVCPVIAPLEPDDPELKQDATVMTVESCKPDAGFTSSDAQDSAQDTTVKTAERRQLDSDTTVKAAERHHLDNHLDNDTGFSSSDAQEFTTVKAAERRNLDKDTGVQSSNAQESTQGTTVMAIVRGQDRLMELVERFSSWSGLKVATAWLLRFKKWLIDTKYGKKKELYTGPTGAIKVSELQKAEIAVVTYVQGEVFASEMKQLGKIGPKMSRSQFHNLHPYKDEAGSVRVGGRLTESDLTFAEKHQLILPRSHHLTEIIVRSYHEAYQHAPPQTLLCLLRKRYWVINGSSVVHELEKKCITCQRAIGLPKDQIQGVLPKGRVTSGNLWIQTGCDIMGPVLTKIRRSQVKRYILGLVSFTVKAVHFEIMPNLTTASFLNAMRRFLARRSRPGKLISDNAGTFSAGVAEINQLQELYNSSGVQHFMQEKNIEWVPNVPKASNRNGLFERPFRTLRRVMLSTLKGRITTEDQLATTVAECELLYNSRPLCAVSKNARDPLPITPMMIINPEPVAAHPPGIFYEKDLIVRNSYRQVQALINEFWSMFKLEYLTSLQERQKSIIEIRNFQVGDLVMLVDEVRLAHRGHYPLGLITTVHPSETDNVMRKVTLRTSTGEFQRPVNKIVLLESSDEHEDQLPNVDARSQ
ncbi:uncharacterized protein LOC135500837 [Lineus longissimus]|uniref:uncharacterized protein LOC135500837 n=1 Tax=Lineus longissimus TaxID=88925 RepID=UPI00315DEFE7